jgi:hypothetical protein
MIMKAPSLLRFAVLTSIVVAAAASSAVAGSRVSVSVWPSQITNEGEEATFRLTASPTPTRRIAVNIFMSGSATNGFDYTLSGPFNKNGQVVFEAGQNTVMVILHAFSDDPRPPVETATMNVYGGGKGSSPGSPSHATVKIENVP